MTVLSPVTSRRITAVVAAAALALAGSSCATSAYEKVKTLTITELSTAFAGDRPGTAFETRTEGQRSSTDLMFLTVTVSNPYRQQLRVRIACERADRQPLELEATHEIAARSDRRLRLGGLMAGPVAYTIRCCVAELPVKAVAPDAGGGGAAQQPACVDKIIPANDVNVPGPM